MRTLAHISDLHFGREDPAVAEGLVADLAALRPALVVNSGDFTQRARRRQFQAAAAYLERLPHPQLCVPGNHDIPLFDVMRRFISPLGRYRKFISDDLFPRYVDDDLAVLGLNTARSVVWKRGRVSIGQIRKMERILATFPPSAVKVVVSHHPFIPPPGEDAAAVELVGQAAEALEVLDRCGIDLMLAGHLHHGYTGDVRTFYPATRRSIIVAQAGTACSHRVRHEPNGYNRITLDRRRMEVEVRQWNGAAFVPGQRAVFTRDRGGWLLTDAG